MTAITMTAGERVIQDQIEVCIQKHMNDVKALYALRKKMSEGAARLETLLQETPYFSEPTPARQHMWDCWVETIAYMRLASESACDFGKKDCEVITSI